MAWGYEVTEWLSEREDSTCWFFETRAPEPVLTGSTAAPRTPAALCPALNCFAL